MRQNLEERKKRDAGQLQSTNNVKISRSVLVSVSLKFNSSPYT